VTKVGKFCCDPALNGHAMIGRQIAFVRASSLQQGTMTMRRLTKLFLALAFMMPVGGLQAGMIDFNTASDDGTSGQPFGSAVDDGTTVDFWVGLSSLACPSSCNTGVELTTAYGAEPGEPTTAFDTTDLRDGGNDSPFLTDEPNGPDQALGYFMVFSGVSIFNLTLDVLDYGGDGGAGAGSTVTLQVFSTPDWDPANLLTAGSIVSPPIGPYVDGLVTTLSFLGSGVPIQSARVAFSDPDIGTGIDNVSWTAVPEPGTTILFGSGLLALAALARKRRTRV
jgi:PEP-CTERM motif